MTMRDEWTDRLSEYLDDELAADERRALESHIAGCEPCAAALDELKRVVDRARALGPRAPSADLWRGIADRIGPGGNSAGIAPFRTRAARRFSFTLQQLAAAAVVIAAVSGVVAWRITRSADLAPSLAPADRRSLDEGGQVRDLMDTPADVQVEPVSMADAQYDAAVADLQRALDKGRGHLDRATVAIVEENLEIIDHAIDQARRALAADPANSYLSSHLVEARRRKLDLLRRATALASETN